MSAFKILILVAFLAVGAHLAADLEAEPIDATLTESPESGECRQFCVPCPSTGNCTVRCRLVGDCREESCSTIDTCDVGFHWSDTACRCLPNGAP